MKNIFGRVEPARFPIFHLLIFAIFVVSITADASAQAPARRNSAASAPDAPSTYVPITAQQRFHWFVTSTVGPTSLAAGLFSAGFGTARNTPKEYGPHWEGYGKRYAMRFSGIATGNAMEAGLGSLWGEDPRYFRDPGKPIKTRIGHAMKATFIAHDREGNLMPAYARYIAIPANNFLSNTWRADSEANSHSAAVRTLYGVLGRMGGNEFAEFWPDLKNLAFHHVGRTPSSARFR
ncbi:MAG TPA: hypothetical protein VN684_10980 [Terriglobales bacterium]|nr:hypothetical protein [Terriglobales bacterium]